MGWGMGRKLECWYLLSHQVRGMSGLHLEGAVLSPEVDGIRDASTSPLIYLVATRIRSGAVGQGDVMTG
jgi:hypothetical protein